MLEGKSILVVDDEPDLREILCDEFALVGAKVAEAPNGREALKRAEENSFDVIVSDLRMPGGDGVALTQALKSRESSSPLIVLMTGFADLTAEEAFEMGAEGFLTKPFHLESIRGSLERLLTPPDERWAKPQDVPVQRLNADASALDGREVSSYLGRGGFFFPGERLSVRIGDRVGFRVGDRLEGVGVVRWIRMAPFGGRGAGAGLEFLSLTPASLKWVLDRQAEQNLQAYLPRGF